MNGGVILTWRKPQDRSNPKLKLLDQVREVMRLKYYATRTERPCVDWIRRYVKFDNMRARTDLDGAETRIELFLSDLAVNGRVAAPAAQAGGEGRERRPAYRQVRILSVVFGEKNSSCLQPLA